MTFIHLRTHTEFSLIDSTIRVEDLIDAAVQTKIPALAITDHMNLFAAVKFYKAALEAGIKPLLGVDALLENTSDPLQPFHLTLLCQNTQGYKNLTQLISKAYTENKTQTPQLQYAWFENRTDGLIALSGGREGDIGLALLSKQLARADKLLTHWLTLFPDRFYLELQRTGRPSEEIYIRGALSLAKKFNLPVVATNDLRFLKPEDAEAHEARVCIHAGWTLQDHRRPRPYTPEQYFKTAEEMKTLFSDIPSAIENTVEIAKRCSPTITLDKVFLPPFETPEGLSTEDFLIKESQEGLQKRLIQLQCNEETQKPYTTRLEEELKVICKIGFAGYFLIVADFIRWAKNQDIPVGPGRGSGAGSLVAYALNITNIDPLPYGLLFERFLNPERVSMPDFDIDFCMDGRDRVIDYVASRYGQHRVSQIITFGTMAAKAVIRDVGRVLAHPYGFVDKIAKLIPFELGMTLEKALEQEPLLKTRYLQEEEVKTLIDLALKLEGLTRNAGKHAGGVVVTPTTLTDFTPLYCEPGSTHTVTQFDKDDVEAIGLVKFDFLGLRTLTIIHHTLQNIHHYKKLSLDISKIPLQDEATFSLLKSCATTAVFQLESRGMKDLIRRLQPDCFEEIIALVALFRPGPLQSGMVDDFINRKHGRANVTYSHPALELILKQTYGVILYQEQVMQIAQVLAGYTLGSADLLRRAMGKKKSGEMAKQREIFKKGAIKNNVPEKTAQQIFDLMEKFAGYGFNKSHSAAYALISYQTAWLKTHYTAEFMAAVLSSDMDNTDKTVLFLQECKHLELTVLPPHINESTHHFAVVSDKILRYGLGAIKGVGINALENILAARQIKLFEGLFDFCKRVDPFKVNRKVIEALLRSGSFDEICKNRASLMKSLDHAIKASEQFHQNQHHKQTDLFDSDADESSSKENLIKTEEWSEQERLKGEKETLGLYLSGHPLARYQQELSHLVTPFQPQPEKKETRVVFAGTITTLRTRLTKKNEKMAFIMMDNGTIQCEVVFFPESFSKIQHLLSEENILVVEGNASLDQFTQGYKIICQNAFTLEQARQHYAKHLLMKIKDQKFMDEHAQTLKEIIKPYLGGKFPLCIEYYNDNLKVKINLDSQWHVNPHDDLLSGLMQFLGKDAVEVCY
ncbi:MAG: hypothetical protein ACD_44C00069G0009 [uncultured bacterium]|nr:MAG: hypothetical protein ACD_44C00069G0009 [uncultured bacterium]